MFVFYCRILPSFHSNWSKVKTSVKHYLTDILQVQFRIIIVLGYKCYSLRKHPFLLALRRWGRFARRNVCDSATEIPSDDVKSVRNPVRSSDWSAEWLHCFRYCLRMTDKSHKATKVNLNAKNLQQNSQYLWNIVFSRRSIRVLWELVGRSTQHFSKIDHKTCKIGQSCIGNPMTTGFIM